MSRKVDCSTLGECFLLPFLQRVNDKLLNLFRERLSSIFTFLRHRTISVAFLRSWSMRLDFLVTIVMLLSRIWWPSEAVLPYFNTNDHMNKAYQPPPSTSDRNLVHLMSHTFHNSQDLWTLKGLSVTANSQYQKKLITLDDLRTGKTIMWAINTMKNWKFI